MKQVQHSMFLTAMGNSCALAFICQISARGTYSALRRHRQLNPLCCCSLPQADPAAMQEMHPVPFLCFLYAKAPSALERTLKLVLPNLSAKAPSILFFKLFLCQFCNSDVKICSQSEKHLFVYARLHLS